MNPNAREFVFNPKATSFVPKTTADSSPPSTPNSQKSEEMADNWEEKAEPVKKVEASASPASAPKSPSLEKETEKLSLDDSTDLEKIEITPELRKELQRMAVEEGVTEEELLKPDKGEAPVEDKREHLNVVFIGHVDAGKSTISGQVLYLTGMVDQRTIEKYTIEAKENNRESWFFAYIMDTNEEERQRGKTVEVGRANFETTSKRYTILDAPGHKTYVPNMIGGASQADVAVMVISARKGEFDAGFKGGQTREHTMLAKALGVKSLIAVINKMDDPTVDWNKDRYDEIVKELTPYLKSVGWNLQKDVYFIPISGFRGTNIKDSMPKSICPWYDGPSLLQCLDQLKPIDRLYNSPLRIPITDKFRERGATVVMGKIESGQVSKGDQVMFIPNKIVAEVLGIVMDDVHIVNSAKAGENIRLMLKGVDEDSIHRGYVLCDPKFPIPCQPKFEAQLAILDLLQHKGIFSAGYTAVLHIHSAVEECEVLHLVAQIDKKTGKPMKGKPSHVKSGAIVNAIIECSQAVPMELFTDNPQLGRFTLRDEGRTIAVGKIISLGKKKPEKTG